MNFLKKYRFVALAAVVFGLASCHGYVDPTVGGGSGDGDSDEALVLSADKETISANGSDYVTFTAMYGSEDVSESRSLVLSYSLDGGELVRISAGSSIFAPKNAGTYVFSATYTLSDGEAVESSNTVTVIATEAQVELKTYGRKVLGMQFTSVGCQNCPILSTFLKEIKQEYAGQIALASFHTDYGGYADPMTVKTTSGLMSKYGIDALPAFALDMDPSLQSTAIKEKISKLIADRLADPAECGIAISSEYDKESGMLAVEVRMTSVVERAYRYAVFLVEDGIRYMQLGVEDKVEYENYTHSNVVRKMLSINLNGDAVNGGKPLVPGDEVVMRKDIAIESGWNLENMRVIAVALASEDGQNWSCENVNECRAGMNADYCTGSEAPDVPDTPDQPGTHPAFERHLCIFEFTGQWCSFCPDGYKILYDVAASEYSDYRDIAHIIALHDNSSGADEFAEPLQATQFKMFNDFALPGYPAALVDLRKDAAVSLSAGNREMLVDAIEKSLAEYPAHCGVAVSSSYDATKGAAKIDTRLYSVKNDFYRIAVFIVENGIKAPQKDGGTTREDYTHHYVGRLMLSQKYNGDSLGEVAAGKEAAKSYDLTVDPKWNVDKTQVYVLAIDGDGHVNNVAVCSLKNGAADYDYAENK